MKYVFMSDVAAGGGPKSRVRNLAAMLQRYAEFEFEIYTKGFERFFRNPVCDILHIHCSKTLLRRALATDLPLIIGPNIVWEKVPKEVLHSKKVLAALLSHEDPVIERIKPEFADRLYQFPVMVDEEFFCPSNETKTYDVLTVGKSFRYPGYEMNLSKLHSLLRISGLSFHHLEKYKAADLLAELRKCRMVMFPSPKESAGSGCHLLVEANMVDVPFIALNALQDKFSSSLRGMFVDSIEQMIPTTSLSASTCPRKWAMEHFSYKAGYGRLKKILQTVAKQQGVVV